MRSTTLTGEVKNLQRVQVAGENSAMFEIGDQSVRLFARNAILDNGDQVIVAGKYQGGLFVSNALQNLTQSETAEKKGMTQLIPYLLATFFICLGLYILADYLRHAHKDFVAMIAAAFLLIGIACLYFPGSRSRQKFLVKAAARDFK